MTEADAGDRLATEVAAALAAGLGSGDPQPLGLAVSGGSDSSALLHLVARIWPRDRLAVATVDHGLRPEAAAEAAQVAAMAAGLGLPHKVLRWTTWDGQGNLQDRARLARQTLLGDWARRQGLAAVCLGHTLDDQAETVLMRLARGSGVDGLSGMTAARRGPDGLLWLRPLLGHRREALRDWLRGVGIGWIEDPSNADPRFGRVLARQFLGQASGIGITAEGLVATADRMAAARKVLSAAAVAAAERLAVADACAIRLGAGVWDLPDDTCWRLVAAALCQVGRDPYRPRLAALRTALDALRSGRRQTLHGCLLLPEAGGLCIQPELRALEPLAAPVPGRWAGWRIDGPETPALAARALGEAGLAQCPYWHMAGLPRRLALTTPGLFEGDALAAAPALVPGPWRAQPAWGLPDFLDRLAAP